LGCCNPTYIGLSVAKKSLPGLIREGFFLC
jgi:hypothetical protein